MGLIFDSTGEAHTLKCWIMTQVWITLIQCIDRNPLILCLVLEGMHFSSLKKNTERAPVLKITHIRYVAPRLRVAPSVCDSWREV